MRTAELRSAVRNGLASAAIFGHAAVIKEARARSFQGAGDRSVGNIEAVSVGPGHPNTPQSLVLASDDNFSGTHVTPILAFEVVPGRREDAAASSD